MNEQVSGDGGEERLEKPPPSHITRVGRRRNADRWLPHLVLGERRRKHCWAGHWRGSPAYLTWGLMYCIKLGALARSAVFSVCATVRSKSLRQKKSVQCKWSECPISERRYWITKNSKSKNSECLHILIPDLSTIVEDYNLGDGYINRRDWIVGDDLLSNHQLGLLSSRYDRELLCVSIVIIFITIVNLDKWSWGWSSIFKLIFWNVPVQLDEWMRACHKPSTIINLMIDWNGTKAPSGHPYTNNNNNKATKDGIIGPIFQSKRNQILSTLCHTSV